MTGPIDMPISQQTRTRVAVVTGTRAEFGLLRPVMEAVARHPHLELLCVAAGSHLVSPGITYHEVKRAFTIAAAVPMQVAGRTGRAADVEATGAGIARFGRAFAGINPAWVVVLGDRIEAFAAASAASIGGFALAHIHGGDRAEGVADEAMRHAITKLANLHFAATPTSGERIVRMGEEPARVHVVGSPAIDGLRGVAPMDEPEFESLGSPSVVVVMHPIGRDDETEEAAMAQVLEGLDGERVLVMHPNLDPGRDGVVRAIEEWKKGEVCRHLERPKFAAMLMRLADRGGVLVGNSSAGLIEAAAMRVPTVDVGRRQDGRERYGNVVHVAGEEASSVRDGVAAARKLSRAAMSHPYGDGRAGERIASVLATTSAQDPAVRRKRCAY